MTRRLGFLLCISFFFCERAEAQLERSSEAARSLAMGSSSVSATDDASALFLNPSGIVLTAPVACYLEYAEPAPFRGTRELRFALAGGSGKTHCGFGWYRLGAEGESAFLLVASVAHRLVEGTQGSFLSIGVNAVAGSISSERSAGDEHEWRGMTGDIGVTVRPLSVISFGFSVANVGDARPDETFEGASWSRVQRWGVSYFWENRLTVSYAGEHRAGRMTNHYGLCMKTAVPIELMAGFSDSRVTGGVRWSGRRCAATIAFASEEERRVTWTGAFELLLGRREDGQRP